MHRFILLLLQLWKKNEHFWEWKSVEFIFGKRNVTKSHWFHSVHLYCQMGSAPLSLHDTNLQVVCTAYICCKSSSLLSKRRQKRFLLTELHCTSSMDVVRLAYCMGLYTWVGQTCACLSGETKSWWVLVLEFNIKKKGSFLSTLISLCGIIPLWQIHGIALST